MNMRTLFCLQYCAYFQTSGIGSLATNERSSAATPTSSGGGGGMRVSSISSQTQALRREWLSRVDPPVFSPANHHRGAQAGGGGRNSSLFRSTCTLQLDPQKPETQPAPTIPIVSPYSTADPNVPPSAESAAAPMSSTIRSIAQQCSRIGPAPNSNSPTALISVTSPSVAPPQLNLAAARVSAPYSTLRGTSMSTSPLPDVASSNRAVPTSPRSYPSQNLESQFAFETSAAALDVPPTPPGTSANIGSVPGTPLRNNAGNVTPTNKQMAARLAFGMPPNSAATSSANTSSTSTPTQGHLPSMPIPMSAHLPFPHQSNTNSSAAMATPSRSGPASQPLPTGATATGSAHFQNQILRGALFANSSQTAAANATLSRRGTIPASFASASNPKQMGGENSSALTNGSHLTEDKPNLRWNQQPQVDSTRSLTSVMGAVTNSIGAFAKATAFGSQSSAPVGGGTLRVGTARPVPDIVPPTQPPALANSSLLGNGGAGGTGTLSRGGGGGRRLTGLFAGSGATSGPVGSSAAAAGRTQQDAPPVQQSAAAPIDAGASYGSAQFPQIIHTAPLHLHQQSRPGNFKSPIAFSPHGQPETSRATGAEAHHSRASSSGSARGGGADASPAVESLGSDYDQPDLVSAHS